MNADEAFLATTPYGMAPVTSVNGLESGGGKARPVFEKVVYGGVGCLKSPIATY